MRRGDEQNASTKLCRLVLLEQGDHSQDGQPSVWYNTRSERFGDAQG
jgi:hypothetical protein